MKFPLQVRLDSCTKRVKEKFFKNFRISKHEPGEVILKAGTMPLSIFFVVKGRVEVRSRTKPLNQYQNSFIAKKALVSRQAVLIEQQEIFGQKICDIKANGTDLYKMIGEECDLLGIASPYSYIVAEDTLVYTVPHQLFFKGLQ